MTPRKGCEAAVYHRDTYRVAHSKSGFRMHYDKKRCQRWAVKDGLCKQHLAATLALERVPDFTHRGELREQYKEPGQ